MATAAGGGGGSSSYSGADAAAAAAATFGTRARATKVSWVPARPRLGALIGCSRLFCSVRFGLCPSAAGQVAVCFAMLCLFPGSIYRAIFPKFPHSAAHCQFSRARLFHQPAFRLGQPPLGSFVSLNYFTDRPTDQSVVLAAAASPTEEDAGSVSCGALSARPSNKKKKKNQTSIERRPMAVRAVVVWVGART